jgi:hypothetical protein
MKLMMAVLETENKKNMRLVLQVAKQFGVSVRSQRSIGGKLSRNYKNPSPSNDPWWDIPENYWEINRRVEEIRNGNAEFVSIDDSLVIQNLFERYGEKCPTTR